VSGGGTTPTRVAVVGAGPVASEVVRNLGLAGIPTALHRPEDFWLTLRLAELQDCYCAVAAGGHPETRRRLNQLSQVAGVDFVNVSLDADGITVETFPFGSDPNCACLECQAPMTGVDTPSQTPDPIAASIAGALAAAAALHCAGNGARRLSIPEPAFAGQSSPLERRADCRTCGGLPRAPRIIRTRNRWSVRESLTDSAAELAAQGVRLSDALVTACECSSCGPTTVLAAMVNHSLAEFGPEIPACPNCGAASVRVETRDTFSLGELIARFGGGPVPAKFALAKIGGASVCFDLESGTSRDADGSPGVR